ncbi:hypothetical protein J4475_01760 [Candidatus Woesearchaeota archaeon]|nr:hypothetical protein [Candidatus Woesearchaeota archaeon]
MKDFQQRINSIVKKGSNGQIVMMELPTDTYFSYSSAVIRTLTMKGFDGVYISFQRPLGNVTSLLKQQKINTKNILFLDIASILGEAAGNPQQAVAGMPADINIDELVKAIYTMLDNLRSRKRFIFIDSLTTIALYKPLSEVMRFSEFLSRTVRSHELENVILIFSVAQELAQKKFIRDIAMRVDEVITL